jgi:hypothetical protein
MNRPESRISDLIFAVAVVLWLIDAGASPGHLLAFAVVFALCEPIVDAIMEAHYEAVKSRLFNRSE